MVKFATHNLNLGFRIAQILSGIRKLATDAYVDATIFVNNRLQKLTADPNSSFNNYGINPDKSGLKIKVSLFGEEDQLASYEALMQIVEDLNRQERYFIFDLKPDGKGSFAISLKEVEEDPSLLTPVTGSNERALLPENLH